MTSRVNRFEGAIYLNITNDELLEDYIISDTISGAIFGSGFMLSVAFFTFYLINCKREPICSGSRA